MYYILEEGKNLSFSHYIYVYKCSTQYLVRNPHAIRTKFTCNCYHKARQITSTQIPCYYYSYPSFFFFFPSWIFLNAAEITTSQVSTRFAFSNDFRICFLIQSQTYIHLCVWKSQPPLMTNQSITCKTKLIIIDIIT